MLNEVLYQALKRRFGPPTVANAREIGAYRLPYKHGTKLLVAKRSKKELAYADVLNPWGESYRVNCPVCGDTKQRLYICYLAGCKMKIRNRWVHFSNMLHKCHRRGCYVWPHLKDIGVQWGEMKPSATPETRASNKPKLITIPLPNNLIPISSGAVPDDVLKYLIERQFDPEMLYKEFDVHYAPPGTVWHTKTDEKGNEYDLTFKYPRLIIPLYRGHHQVSWQARIAMDPVPSGVPKYINCPGGLNKTELIYNMDKAKWHTEIGIFEGVTDVWRAGPASIALFGKGISNAQIEIIKDLWSHYGFGVLIPDGDDPDAAKKGLQTVGKLLKEEAFGHGAVMVSVPSGKDPSQHTKKTLDEWKATGVRKIIEVLKKRAKSK